MTFRCLDGIAVALTLRPALIREELCLEVQDAPAGACVAFRGQGSTLYRTLDTDARCAVPACKLADGILTVTIYARDAHATVQRWRCEELCVERQASGEVLVYLCDAGFRRDLLELKLEGHAFGKRQEELSGRVKGLEKKIEELLSGYDFV